MKQTIINGCGFDATMLKDCLQKFDIQIPDNSEHIVDLNSLGFRGCAGCDACQSRRPGKCAVDDGLNRVLELYLQSDRVVLFASVRFGSFDAKSKHFLDRTEPLFLPYQIKKEGHTRMKSRYTRYPELLIVGVQDKVDTEEAEVFRKIAQGCSLTCASPKAEVKTICRYHDN